MLIAENAALARLSDYLRRAPQRTEEQELVARDAFVAGFQYGTRWAIRTSAALSNQDTRAALFLIAEALSNLDASPDDVLAERC